MAYQNVPFQNSPAHNAVATAPAYQLQNARPYYESAIAYHEAQDNAEQAKFFSDGLAFIDGKLAKGGTLQ